MIFPDVEVLDFCGPYEVCSVTRLDKARPREALSPYKVLLVAEQPGVVRATGGLRVLPDHTLDDCPSLDLLVVPGGWGTRALLEHAPLLNWLRERGPQSELLTLICTGSLLLGKAGLLDGRRATTHWRSLDWMQELLPAARVVRDEHVVEDGRVLTSAGISAGIDRALRVVARTTARYMEYPLP